MMLVLDTNVIVFGFWSPNGKPSQILRRVFNFEDILVYDARILKEYQDVLTRKKFGFPEQITEYFLSFVREFGYLVTSEPLEIPFADPDDKKFYEVAKYCNATLVTGNLKHFPSDPLVKSVQEIIF
jgi:putative PIN family toxin of toxin-antitoxin system